jgi:hypothetical protein
VSGTVKLCGRYGISSRGARYPATAPGPRARRIRSSQTCPFCWAFKVTFANERSEVPGAMIIVAPTCFVGSTVKVCEERGIRPLYLRKSGGLLREAVTGTSWRVRYSGGSSCNRLRCVFWCTAVTRDDLLPGICSNYYESPSPAHHGQEKDSLYGQGT